MDFFSAGIYGILQGLTEFLPVSSSGHLALLPHVLSIKDPGVVFDLAMHVGTALSIICYFFKDIAALFNALFSHIKGRPSEKSYYAINMLLATVITFIFVLLLKGIAFKYARTPQMIALNLALFGLLMFLADVFYKDHESHLMSKIQGGRAFLIGFFQALAIFPGVSRSGATLTISRAVGLGREESTRFSFLLSLPIIIAGFVYKVPALLQGQEAFSLSTCAVGILISFGVGLITIHYFLKFIKRMGLWLFSLYRLILAGIIIANTMVG